MAGSGSDYICTYCDASRSNIQDPPYFGSKDVTLTSSLLEEASYYCNLNPGKKSQAQVVKHSFGTKDSPLTFTEPEQEVPDALHLDLNVTPHLITIACRIFLFGGQENAIFQYNKTENQKKAMDMSSEKYFRKLREKITSLPSLTQYPGNFTREFCDPKNADFVKEPLPECPEKETWCRLMTLWRSMRMIHKSNSDPTFEQIELFKVMAEEFQEKIYSMKWVTPANQVHRLSHLAYFMQTREIKSIGAFSLEGLGHGNWSTKYFEGTRIWRGDSKIGNRQVFRLLRWNGSPTLRRAALELERTKRKPDRCAKCGASGHKKNMHVCPLYNQVDNDETIDDIEEVNENENDDDDDDESTDQGESDVSDEHYSEEEYDPDEDETDHEVNYESDY